jgi:retinol dehydrogenase-12
LFYVPPTPRAVVAWSLPRAQGHFALTEHLLPALKRSAPSRVVNVSSVGQWIFAPPDGIPSDILRNGKYDDARLNSWKRYGVSKLANVLHASELQRRYGADGVTAFSLHPGNIRTTNLMRTVGMAEVGNILMTPIALYAAATDLNKSIPAGAATTVVTAMAPLESLSPGAYYADCRVATSRVHAKASDAGLAKALWDNSVRLVGAALR